jgi:hypothetical protein
MFAVETDETLELLPEGDEEMFELSEVEMETLKRAAVERTLPYDVTRRCYSYKELRVYGMVREAYTRQELGELGFGSEEVSCFDSRARVAQELLKVDVPFGNGIQKWQLPIDMMPMRVLQVVYPPNTTVERHVHPANAPDDPGGGLRIVTSGRIFYKGNEYGPGDWFFVPNGVPYTFSSDPDVPTVTFYKYRFFGAEQGNRFSHPSAVSDETQGTVETVPQKPGSKTRLSIVRT